MIDSRRRARIILVVALVLGSVALGMTLRLFLLDRPGTPAASGGAAAPTGGPFTLVDQDGRTRTDAEFRGSLMLVYFGYSSCPDICPAELTTIGATLDRLGDEARGLQPIFITIDPERDTAARLKSYIAHFTSRLLGLTGTPAQIAVVAKSYRVYYAKVPIEGGGKTAYLMDYSGLVYLIGRDGRYLTHFTPQTTAEQMARTIGKYF
ncbi:MAG TPA: SCO family protein [Alphaproteobacteria bacterium]|nr:SCO family protein [Alphaproteobacteria bacterium]